jgi:7-cyano-7-deazaguanine synthase
MSKITDVVLYSGGMDSTVLLYSVMKDTHPNSMAVLSFNYGQRHHYAESIAAGLITDKLGIARHIVDLRSASSILQSSLTNMRLKMPTAAESDEHKGASVVVPSRNAIMLSIAHGFAESIGATRVWIGSHKGDYELFPDCREDFFTKLNSALTVGSEKTEHVTIMYPFTGMYKTELAAKGVELGVSLNETWSCYDPRRRRVDVAMIHVHCGECLACRERHTALTAAGVKDNTIYVTKPVLVKPKSPGQMVLG